MKFLAWIRATLVRLETFTAAFSLLLLLGLALAQILARNFFSTGLADADTLIRYLVLYILFVGAALAADRDRHISIDVCSTLLSEKAMRALYRPLNALTAIICAIFSDAAIRFWKDELQFAPDHEHWLVLVELIVPIGFLLLTLQFALNAIQGPDRNALQ